MFNKLFNKFNKISPYSAKIFSKIADKSLTISKNKSFKMDPLVLLRDSSMICGIIGAIVGFHQGAKLKSKERYGSIEIMIGGIVRGCSGGIVGVVFPISVPFLLVASGYRRYYI